MCEYLFAAFSMKRGPSEGLSSKQLKAVRRWERSISKVATQEMMHLSLVNNMLVAIGAAPYFYRPNFPHPSSYFPPNIQLALLPFGERALRHFLFLERPEGMAIEQVPGFDIATAEAPADARDEIVPGSQYFSTVGDLYRGIERGFTNLVEKYGEKQVFIGSSRTQATEEYFGWPQVVAVTDLDSTGDAIQGIVEAGEGARGKWEKAHFGRFLRILNEYLEMKKNYANFVPARPVVPAYVRPPGDVDNVVMISEPLTAGVSDLFNASYGMVLQILSRFFMAVDTTRKELTTLSDAAVEVMINAIKPLGILLTTLPVGPHLPGVTAGPSFDIHRRPYFLPHREEARMILRERLLEIADYAGKLLAEPSAPAQLVEIQKDLRQVAKTVTQRAAKS